MKSTDLLRQELDKVLNKYIKKFEKAHGVELEFAVCDDLMGVLCFGDHFFNMSDIVYDVDNKLPVGLIFEWQDAGIRAHFNGNKETISLHSYAKGLRYEGVE
jgi:hypothetical protein